MSAESRHCAKGPASVWEFFNSSFGIFLMSSVLLGLLSFSYTAWREYVTRGHSIEQLDIEIALRLQAMEQMCTGKDNNRYSNLVNVNKVMSGDTDVSFYVRKPIFNSFEQKSLTTLLWQLYLLVPNSERMQIKDAIRQSTELSEEIRKVRYARVTVYEDLPKPKTQAEQDKQNDRDDIFVKDYGQTDIYKRVAALHAISRWHSLAI